MTARTTEDVDEELAQENKIRSRHSLDRTDQRLRSFAVRLGTKLENKVVYFRIVNDLSLNRKPRRHPLCAPSPECLFEKANTPPPLQFARSLRRKNKTLTLILNL